MFSMVKSLRGALMYEQVQETLTNRLIDIREHKNTIPCDFYLGKGFGKKLREDILHAKESVLIVSPFVSPALIEETWDLLFKKKVVFTLIANEPSILNLSYDQMVAWAKIAGQSRIVNETSKKRFEQLVKISKVLKVLIIVLLVATLILLVKFGVGILEEIVEIGSFPTITFNGFMPTAALLVLSVLSIITRYIIKKIARKTVVYTYEYTMPNICFLPNKKQTHNPIVHSKIYIIDKRIIYVGSGNFTYNGTRNNLEARVRIMDSQLATNLYAEFAAEIGPYQQYSAYIISRFCSEPINDGVR
jgi:hypothetical protein